MQICWIQTGYKCLISWVLLIFAVLKLLGSSCYSCCNILFIKDYWGRMPLHVLFRSCSGSLNPSVLGFFLTHITFIDSCISYFLASRLLWVTLMFSSVKKTKKPKKTTPQKTPKKLLKRQKSRLYPMLDIWYLCVFAYLHSEPLKLCVCVHCTLFHQNNVK